MKIQVNFLKARFRPLLAAVVLTFLLYPPPTHADVLEVSLQSPLTAVAGSTDNGFDVLLTNTSGPAVSIAGFTFEILMASSDVTLTEANSSTSLAPYIFAGNSLFGPDINTSAGQNLIASDLYASAGNVTLASGATLGLGHVLFDVAGSAPTETVDLTLTALGTSLSDASGNAIPIASLTGGQIDISTSATVVPEPSALVLVLTVMPFVLAPRKSRK